jgi:hypothetical protein
LGKGWYLMQKNEDNLNPIVLLFRLLQEILGLDLPSPVLLKVMNALSVCLKKCRHRKPMFLKVLVQESLELPTRLPLILRNLIWVYLKKLRRNREQFCWISIAIHLILSVKNIISLRMCWREDFQHVR